MGGRPLVARGVVSLGVVAISEPLVQTLEVLVAHTHLSELFIGLILLPLFGSTAEGVIAIGAASRGRMDLAITSTMESSGQLMLFVLPVLVLIGWPLGRFLHLSVPLSALGCTGVAVLAVQLIKALGVHSVQLLCTGHPRRRARTLLATLALHLHLALAPEPEP